jgi:hypothetical protein
LRRRIRHLEHDLRDITARCHAERERRMSLEALIGVRSSSSFDSRTQSHFHLTTVPLFRLL